MGNVAEARQRALREITAAMRKTGLSASALATKAGVSPSTLNRFLREPESWPVPNTTTLAKVAAAAARHDAGSADEERDRLQARAMDLAEAMGVKMPRERMLKFSRLMLEIGSAPDRTEEILDQMMKLLRR